MAKAIVRQVKSGKFKGQWRFKLMADNGSKNLSPNDSYHNEQDMLDTLGKYFPNFEVVYVDRQSKPLDTKHL